MVEQLHQEQVVVEMKVKMEEQELQIVLQDQQLPMLEEAVVVREVGLVEQLDRAEQVEAEQEQVVELIMEHQVLPIQVVVQVDHQEVEQLVLVVQVS